MNHDDGKLKIAFKFSWEETSLKTTISSNRKSKESPYYVCDEVFPTKRELEKHAKKEHLEPVTCRRCPSVEFRSRASLSRHITSVHGDQTFACSKCD